MADEQINHQSQCKHEIIASWWSLTESSSTLADLTGIISAVHMDVMDGSKGPAIMLPSPTLVHDVHAAGLRLDVHLMVAEPPVHAQAWIEAGADRIFIHLADLARDPGLLNDLISPNFQLGVAIELDDPLDNLETLGIHVDVLMVMGTALGIKGQDMHKSTIPRIRHIASARPDAIIIADGGIRSESVGPLAIAGADGVVAGSLLFAHPTLSLAASAEFIRGLMQCRT